MIEKKNPESDNEHETLRDCFKIDSKICFFSYGAVLICIFLRTETTTALTDLRLRVQTI